MLTHIVACHPRSDLFKTEMLNPLLYTVLKYMERFRRQSSNFFAVQYVNVQLCTVGACQQSLWVFSLLNHLYGQDYLASFNSNWGCLHSLGEADSCGGTRKKSAGTEKRNNSY